MTPTTATATGTRRASCRKPAGRARKRLIAPDDLTRFQLLGDPQISPDGERVLFTHKQVGEKNQYVTNLWIAPTKPSSRKTSAASSPVQFTSGGKDGSGRWSPDGQRIAFISRRNKHKPQVYVIDADGGEAQQLTHFPEGSIATMKWSPTGKHLAVRPWLCTAVSRVPGL